MSNGFNMPQMPFPFFPFQMPGAGAGDTGAQPQNAFPFMFPFGGMNMPQMPFPFFPFQMPGMGQNAGGETNAQPGAVPFPSFFPFPTQDTRSGGEQKSANPFSLLGIAVPETLLKKLLTLDASPKTLEKLQKALDLVFSILPEKKDGEEEEEEDE